MPTSVISNTARNPAGAAVAGVKVTARLWPGPGFRVSDGSEVASFASTTSDALGFWSLVLEETANISPAGTAYIVEEDFTDNDGGPRLWMIQVGAADATLQASLVSAIPEPSLVAYLTQAAADARYTGSIHPDLAAHDTLGLATQAELDAVAAAKANTSHGHTAVTTPFTPAGTVASTNVQAAIEEVAADVGDASADLIVHTAAATGAHAASAITFTPTGTVASTNVQAAIAEVAAEAGAGAHPDLATHDTMGLATQAELDAHAADTTAVHGITDTSALVVTTDPRLSDARTPTAHTLTGASHTASGLTAGHVVRATGATTFAFGAIQDADLPATIARDSEVTSAVSAHEADTTNVHGIADTSQLVLTTDLRFTTLTANRQTASYTLVLSDAGKVIEMNVAGANTLTVPTNASVAFPVGTVVAVWQYGAGQTTIAGPSVTLRAPDGLVLGEQYAAASLRKVATDEWEVQVAAADAGHPDLAAHDTLGLATQAELDAHVNDTTAAHAASAISFTATGGVAATDVQAAIAELDTEKSGTGHTHTLTVQDEGVSLSTSATTLNFIGAGVTASGTTDTKTINIPGGGSGITVQEEGTPLTTSADTLNFIGTAITAAGTTGTKTITVRAIQNADVDAAASIAESKLNLASDAAAGTASRRTLGTGSTQAAAGNHTHSEPEVILVVCSDETTAITAGTNKVKFRMPFAMTLSSVRASLSTASSSGIPTFDINEAGVSILSTKLTIDATETTSTTAATPPVISDTALADDAEISIDFDVAGTGATGVKIALIGTRT